MQRRQRLPLVAQQPVRVVLEDEQLAPARDGHELTAPAQRHGHARGVLEVGDRVDELRPSPRGVEVVEQGIELVDAHAVAIGRHVDDVCLVRAERRDRARVRRALRHDHVTRVDQRLAHEVYDLLPAGGDEHLVGVNRGVLRRHHLDDAVLHHGHALGRPVLERPRAGLRRDRLHERGIALGREGRRVGQSARERDDLGALGDRHQVAHRRRLHDPSAGREETGIALDVARRGTPARGSGTRGLLSARRATGRPGGPAAVVYRHAAGP
jgi:hypothetical protein